MHAPGSLPALQRILCARIFPETVCVSVMRSSAAADRGAAAAEGVHPGSQPRPVPGAAGDGRQLGSSLKYCRSTALSGGHASMLEAVEQWVRLENRPEEHSEITACFAAHRDGPTRSFSMAASAVAAKGPPMRPRHPAICGHG